MQPGAFTRILERALRESLVTIVVGLGQVRMAALAGRRPRSGDPRRRELSGPGTPAP